MQVQSYARTLVILLSGVLIAAAIVFVGSGAVYHSYLQRSLLSAKTYSSALERGCTVQQPETSTQLGIVRCPFWIEP
jgi:hypothetical protein